MIRVDDLAKQLREAAQAVDEAALPDDLREIGFARALDALGLPESGLTAEGGAAAAAGPQIKSQVGGPGDGLLDRIAERLGLDIETVEQVYEVDDGQVRLVVKRSTLPAGKAASMRAVGLLVTVGRQAAGLEETTSAAVLRDECRELRVLDTHNFATEISKLELRALGGAQSKNYKAHRHHFDEATALIRNITTPAND